MRGIRVGDANVKVNKLKAIFSYTAIITTELLYRLIKLAKQGTQSSIILCNLNNLQS